MQLLRESDVPFSNFDRVFRYPRARAVVAYGLCFAGCAALFAMGVDQHVAVLEFAGILTAACVVLARRFALARFRASNWLVRATENGVYVKFRSYLNYHFSSGDLTVAFIPFREIRVARSVRERREIPEVSRGGRAVSVQTLQIAELELTCDTTALGAALAEERARPAPRVATWYGNTGVKFNHEPVVLADPVCVRVTWECVPRLPVFLRTVARHVTVDQSTTRSTSYVNLEGLTRAEQEQRITELARSGQLVAAITIARRLYAYDVRRAREYVESLRRGSVSLEREMPR